MPTERHPKMSVTMLKAVVRYDPETGKLYWRFRTPDMFRDGIARPEARCAQWNHRHATKEAFAPLPGGRLRQETIFGRAYVASHVVWALVHGHWPDGHIERADGDLANHHHSNLILRPYGMVMNGIQRARAAADTQPTEHHREVSGACPHCGQTIPRKSRSKPDLCDTVTERSTPPRPEPQPEPVNPLNPYRGVHWGSRRGMWAAIDRTNETGPDDNLPQRGITSGKPRLINTEGYATAEDAREAVLRAERAAGYTESLSIPPLHSVWGYNGVYTRDPDHPAICDDYPAGQFFAQITTKGTLATRVFYRGPFASPDEAEDEYWRIMGPSLALRASDG